MMDGPRVIGLTGGIASGKSTASRMLAEHGVPIVDADVVARDVVEPGTDGLRAVVEAFGESVLRPDGSLDREALGEIVFGDPEARRTLNGITHPRIAQRMMQRTEGLAAEGYRWLVYDAALIVENGLHHALAGLIVVSCDDDVQMARLLARDGIDSDHARERIESQLPLADKRAVADWIIDNNGTLEDLRESVAQLYGELVRRFGPVRTA